MLMGPLFRRQRQEGPVRIGPCMQRVVSVLPTSLCSRPCSRGRQRESWGRGSAEGGGAFLPPAPSKLVPNRRACDRLPLPQQFRSLVQRASTTTVLQGRRAEGVFKFGPQLACRAKERGSKLTPKSKRFWDPLMRKHPESFQQLGWEGKGCRRVQSPNTDAFGTMSTATYTGTCNTQLQAYTCYALPCVVASPPREPPVMCACVRKTPLGASRCRP